MAPPGPDGKKVFSNWQRFMELDEAEIPKSTDRSPLTLDELLQAPLHIFGSEFPGLRKTVSRFRDRIYLEARRHYQSNNAVARALKVSSGTASTNLTRIESHQPSKV
jgi:hypothetical protein